MGMLIIALASSLLLGVMFKPQLGWFILGGWKYKTVEPTGDSLALSRVSAFILLFILWLVIVPFSSVV